MVSRMVPQAGFVVIAMDPGKPLSTVEFRFGNLHERDALFPEDLFLGGCGRSADVALILFAAMNLESHFGEPIPHVVEVPLHKIQHHL